MDAYTAELAARVAALETKVAELYAALDLVEPSGTEAVAQSIPDEVAELARAGKIAEAVRAMLVQTGTSTADASARVNGYLRSIGH